MVVARAHAIVPSSAAPMSSASTGSSNSSTAVPTNPSSVMRDSSAPARRDELRFAWSQRSSESRCFRSFVVIMIMVSYTDLITALIGRRTCVQKFWNLRNVIQKPCMTDIYLHFLCAHYGVITTAVDASAKLFRAWDASDPNEEGLIPLASFRTGAWPYNRPCAQQYVGKSQSCMVISGRLIVHAPVFRRCWYCCWRRAD